VYRTTTVDSAVDSLTAAVQDTMEQTIPRGIIKSKWKFSHWYSSSMSYYIRNKKIFSQTLRKTYCLNQNCSFYRKLVKATIKSDRLRRLKSIDGNLKSQPKQFWKYVASFRKKNSASLQVQVDNKHLIEPCDVDDEFSKHFQSVYNNLCPVVFPTFRHLLNFYL
jgi:hypothetical protein